MTVFDQQILFLRMTIAAWYKLQFEQELDEQTLETFMEQIKAAMENRRGYEQGDPMIRLPDNYVLRLVTEHKPGLYVGEELEDRYQTDWDRSTELSRAVFSNPVIMQTYTWGKHYWGS